GERRNVRPGHRAAKGGIADRFPSQRKSATPRSHFFIFRKIRSAEGVYQFMPTEDSQPKITFSEDCHAHDFRDAIQRVITAAERYTRDVQKPMKINIEVNRIDLGGNCKQFK